MALLRRLCLQSSRVVYSERNGTYHIIVGTHVHEQVQSKTLEALVNPRLLTRDRATDFASYVITDRGRDVLHQYLASRCVALGHAAGCERQECTAAALPT
jgi:predicted transcriptional regulator